MKSSVVVSLMLLAVGAASGQGPSDTADSGLETERLAMEKWIETRRQASREAQDWRVGKEIMEDRMQVIRKEIEGYRERTAQAGAEMSEADRKLAGMVSKNDELKASTTGLAGDIVQAEARLTALLLRLPAPIRERVRPLSQRIPDQTADTRLTLSERFQNVIGILNEINKFSREIIVASEVRDLPGGDSAEVTTIYLGIGRAFYCHPRGIAAGVGFPGSNGWVWEPRNELAPAIAEALEVYRNERPASYVLLPVELK